MGTGQTLVLTSPNDTIRHFMQTPGSFVRSGSVVEEDDDKPLVSIVVPAFNEAARIGDSIRKIDEFMRTSPGSFELLVVDDGSVDDTVNLVKRSRIKSLQLVQNDQNRGKGYSVRRGVLAASGKYVLFTDADLSAPIE